MANIERLVREPMEGRLFWIWRRNNALLYPGRVVQTRIEEADQRIASVAVVTSRTQVFVTLSEYVPTFRYCLPRLTRGESGVLTVPTQLLDGSDVASTTSTSSEQSHLSWATTTSTSSGVFFEGDEQLTEGLLELPRPDDVAIDTHDCYWADDRGYLFARAPQYSGSPLLTITESDTSRNASLGTKAPIGTFIFSDDEFTHLTHAIEQLRAANFALRRIVRMQSGDVLLDVGYPWNLALNIKHDPKESLHNFFLGLAELGIVATGDKSQLKVIDVRFGNKVFYR
ncbi:MAG TPA: hypothetical protein VJ579_00780 [Candidatus Paceibacterota bacterium]|nr:hypothetical protein [Candidatus Paceibacterota bacterium]